MTRPCSRYRRVVKGRSRMGGTIVPTMTSFHLGLDLGGTNIKWVVLEVDAPSLRVVARGQAPPDVSRGKQSLVDQLIDIARDSSPDLIQSVGVGVPGLYDPVAGSTRFMPNVPGKWAGVPVAAEVSTAVGVQTRLINDARGFTLAEHRLGAGRGVDSMLGITLGTGIGGGLILGGALYMGHDGTAGEFGHLTIVPDGPRCNCGSRGCLEALAR